MQAANVVATARAFSIPLRHLRRAIWAGELTTYSTRRGPTRRFAFSRRAQLASQPSGTVANPKGVTVMTARTIAAKASLLNVSPNSAAAKSKSKRTYRPTATATARSTLMG